jgi:hypothetical protein
MRQKATILMVLMIIVIICSACGDVGNNGYEVATRSVLSRDSHYIADIESLIERGSIKYIGDGYFSHRDKNTELYSIYSIDEDILPVKDLISIYESNGVIYGINVSGITKNIAELYSKKAGSSGTKISVGNGRTRVCSLDGAVLIDEEGELNVIESSSNFGLICVGNKVYSAVGNLWDIDISNEIKSVIESENALAIVTDREAYIIKRDREKQLVAYGPNRLYIDKSISVMGHTAIDLWKNQLILVKYDISGDILELDIQNID